MTSGTEPKQPPDAVSTEPPSEPTSAEQARPVAAAKPAVASSTETAAKPSTAPVPPKPAAPAKPPAPPPVAFVAEPSLPVSMANSPDHVGHIQTATDEQRFDGELAESFETALSRVKKVTPHSALMEALKRGLSRLLSARTNDNEEELTRTDLKVAFDGFRSELYDEKIERDRRYGTVYTVTEEDNAYLVRLEMPRRAPRSALKRLWDLPDEMPNYDYSLSLSDNVLSIRGAVPGEALRRLSYVSPSFPSDFMTRIEFAKPVSTFRHRLRDKNLEVIVFRREDRSVKSAA